MSIWALSDPHLSFGSDKPMDVFGEQWANHPEMIRQHWIERVRPEDTVLMPGDISWAMNFHEVLPDLRFIDSLPGHKLIGRGNHDYWWDSLAKMDAFCAAEGLSTLRFMRHNAVEVEGVIITNTRGWILPDDREFGEQDAKIYRRELIRLKLSLDAAEKLRSGEQTLLATFHYPPVGPRGIANALTEMLESYGVDACIYGHVHGQSPRYSFNGTLNGISYKNTACDFLGFRPLLLYGQTHPLLGLPYFAPEGYNRST